ncbi:MAG TPA: flagellar motor switch protein FliM [Fimbriimonadaceae bacterium]|jgi:flagellar motor switch protein FliM
MSDILSQAEIEALLNSLNSDSEAAGEVSENDTLPRQSNLQTFSDLAPARTVSKFNKAYEVYDFRRPDKFSKDQLRTLQMLHETFARLAGSGLSAYLRTAISMDLISIEQVPYEEYLRSISQSVFTVMSLTPLAGQAVLEIEFGLIFTMIDRMLGGPGRAISRNVLTDIERPLVRQTIERMFATLKTAWEGVVVVNPTIEGMETSAQFVQIAPPNDIVVTILFEVKIGTQRGAMSLCIPYLLLKPVTAKLSAQKWFSASSRKQTAGSRKQLSNQINHTEVECTVRLGKAKLDMKDFLALRPGDVLRLDQRTEKDLLMLVGKIPKFEGKPALQGKKIVFTVSKAIEE